MITSPVQPGAETALELWAGAECTVNRVGDRYFQQLPATGHETRLDDMDRLAALGAKRVRFPVIWERCAPDSLDAIDFSWSDARLERLRVLGLEPIIGLVHHGSGPRYTSLHQPSFAEGLARFAARVAERYPWVKAFTPINEPMTTARFSTLYGIWYPHARDLATFYGTVVNEVLATRASMAAIRRVTPGAELYQTEELGRIFATDDLREQCAYENERRWLAFDLMFGRVGAEHPLRRELERHGVAAKVLDQLEREPSPPQLLGINYYLTSDRFLDSRRERYPRHRWGGNGRQAYADVEAVRARAEGIVGHEPIIGEVWQRYGTACAITEVQLSCHREDQIRWLSEAWRGAQAARAKGADVRAVTVWSVFGAVGWKTLVCDDTADYEPGAYDVRAPVPRATAIARVARALARDECLDGLACDAGWWRCRSRLTCSDEHPSIPERERPSLLVIGSGDFVARVSELCGRRFRAVMAPTLDEAHRSLRRRLNEQRDLSAPWALVIAPDPLRPVPELQSDLELHAAGITEYLAPGHRTLMLSSSRVFSGRSERPYLESDAPDASDAEGEYWQAIERAVIELLPHSLIIRADVVMDATLPSDAMAAAVDALRRGATPELPAGGVISPTYLPHLLDASLDLLVDDERGTWHLAPVEPSSPREVLQRTAALVGLPPILSAVERADERAREHLTHALASERGWPLPDLDATLAAYASELLEPSSKSTTALTSNERQAGGER